MKVLNKLNQGLNIVMVVLVAGAVLTLAGAGDKGCPIDIPTAWDNFIKVLTTCSTVVVIREGIIRLGVKFLALSTEVD